jgi:hypothetical protein
MYVIYTAQLEDYLPPDCRVTEFADDVCVFSSEGPLEAAIRITEDVNKVDETLQNLGPEISPQKTEFMVFSPNNWTMTTVGPLK